jgi:hypothetical protein
MPSAFSSDGWEARIFIPVFSVHDFFKIINWKTCFSLQKKAVCSRAILKSRLHRRRFHDCARRVGFLKNKLTRAGQIR